MINNSKKLEHIPSIRKPFNLAILLLFLIPTSFACLYFFYNREYVISFIIAIGVRKWLWGLLEVFILDPEISPKRYKEINKLIKAHPEMAALNNIDYKKITMRDYNSIIDKYNDLVKSKVIEHNDT